MRVLILQNNMLLNNNTTLHQQVQQLALRLNQQQIDSNRQLQETLSNLSDSIPSLKNNLQRVFVYILQ